MENPRRTDSQFDKFKQAARELECDDDEKRFDERITARTPTAGWQ